MLTLQALNAMDQDSFTTALCSLFEGPPWIVTQTWYARPFTNLQHLHQALCVIMYSASVEQQVALLQAHPDLVGHAALAGTLSPASHDEQASAKLNHLSPEEITRFQHLNQAYHDKFGFPFVICAREHKKASILTGFVSRIQHSRLQEIEIALGEVAKICSLRLHDTLPEEDLMNTQPSYTISYGKVHVPLYRVYAHPLAGLTPIAESAFIGRENTPFAMEVDIEVLGKNFLPAYTRGDNAQVVATDSMKNFVLQHALTFDGSTHEGFLNSLAHAFMNTYPHVAGCRLTARELPFATVCIPQNGSFAESKVLFKRSHDDFTIAELRFERNDDAVILAEHRCGRVDLQLLKITGSSFTHFVRDTYTTLPERSDRPLFIYLDVYWKYNDVVAMLSPDLADYVAAEQVRDLVQTVFHEFVSESIQHLVHEMGQRLLMRFPQLAEISFEAQNRTKDPVATSEVDARVKVYSDPFSAYGIIKLTIQRNEVHDL